ncbi:MAG: carbohydrate kinase family protein [Tepidisphaeraceae bacterium]|jgi:sugar/nucleoside kinase (ribokinase family)
MDVEPIAAEIIVAGHICLDIIPALQGSTWPEPGQLVRIGPAAVSTGGAVANTGLALHRLGVPVRMMGKLGDDAFGHIVIDLLRGYAPSLAAELIVTPEESTSYSIVLSPSAVDRSFMHCPGANDTFAADDVCCDRLAGARLFHFGYPPIMRKMCADEGFQLRRLFQRVRGMGLATSLDMAQPDAASEARSVDWEALLRRVLPLVDVFSPSVEELLFMLDRLTYARLKAGEPQARVVDGPLLRRLGKRLVQMGTAVAVIKLGDRGLYVRTAAETDRVDDFCRRLSLDSSVWQACEIYSPCFRAKEVVGTTGAGDCTIAGFLTSLLRGESPIQAATAAAAVGACSVEAADATGGVKAWAVVWRRLRAGWQRLPADISWGQDVTPVQDKSGTLHLQPRKCS